jgi:beta-N-acetylhexosaminidase
MCNATGGPRIEPPPAPLAPADAPALAGDLPTSGGFGLVVWIGGPVDDLVGAATDKGCDVSAVWSNNAAGDFISYIPGALDAANAAWYDRFPDGSMSGDSAVVVACRGDDVASMSLQEKVGQLIFAGIPGIEVGDPARHLFNDLHIGNIVIMGNNAGTPAQVAALTAGIQQLALNSNGIGALIATDQEGGTVQRLVNGFTDLPDARTVGEAADPDLARQYGAMVGSELRAVGVNMALAPVLDVNDNPDNPVIGRRAFGTTPDEVIAVALPFIEGLRSANVIATGKHFPGHGSTETDSHFTLPVVHKTVAELEATELAPFRGATQAGIGAVMVAHVAYPALDASGVPASISQPIVTGVLKQELGFDGVVVTDDMAMAGITGQAPPAQSSVKAIAAGADIVICVSLPCDPETTQAAIIDAVNTGQLSMGRIDDAVRHILALKQAFDVSSGAMGDITAVGSTEHQAIVDQVIAEAGG